MNKSSAHFLSICLTILCLVCTACGGGGGGSGSKSNTAPPSIPDHVLLVNHSATGANDGSSWADAFSDLQTALAAATSDAEIWVAAGTYYPTTASTRTATFQLLADIEIYGGFDGAEFSRSERDVSANATILSGDIGVLAVDTDNVYHVVTAVDDGLLDGFTIRDGYAGGAGVTLGGGVYCNNTSPILSNCTIVDNYAESGGAGIYCADSTDLQLLNCSINNNSSGQHGAGIYSTRADVLIKNCSIYDNNAVNSSGGIHFLYGNCELINCRITDNTATYYGGVYFYDSDSAQLTNCTISSNNATTNYGGYYAIATDQVLKNCIIWGNKIAGAISNDFDEDVKITDGTSSVSYSLFKQSYGTNGVSHPHATPLFTDAALGDYTLLDQGPAIDVGDNNISETQDLAGNPRIANGFDVDYGFAEVVDIGAYENQTATPAGPQVIFVDKNASGGNDGSSWTDAYTELQAALTVATSGKDVWVAEGTYYPTTGTDRTTTFQLVDGVDVYGGFNASTSERDVEENLCVLSGDIGTLSDASDNVGHVVTAAGSGILDGFIIRDGNAVGVVSTLGGGFFCVNATPNLYNCIISNNNAANGGGVYVGSTSTVTLTKCIIENNQASSNVGGIYAENATLNLSECLVRGNSASGIGGIYSYSSTVMISDCSISGNTAETGSIGGLSANGSSIITMHRCAVFDNEAFDRTGGVELDSSSGSELINCRITDNSAANYAGLFLSNSGFVDVINCTISGNNAATSNGGLYNYQSDLTLLNTIIWGNMENGGISSDLTEDYAKSTIATSAVSYCLFKQSLGSNGVTHSFETALFTDAANADYTLLDAAPAIDVGDNTVTEAFDLAGNARKVNGPDLNDVVLGKVVDLGAYEHQGAGASALLAPVGNN